MATPDSLLSRIRGEYLEMPGLRLTFAQACRLWHLEAAACTAVLEELVAERFLRRTKDDTYVVLSGIRLAPVKATLAGFRMPAADTGRTA
jgi:hypothetical protein